MNPEPFLRLDRIIHEKVRLAIMSLLAASPQLAFTEMRETLGMTDGNLTTHLRTLHEAGYTSVTKAFQGGRPLTTPTNDRHRFRHPTRISHVKCYPAIGPSRGVSDQVGSDQCSANNSMLRRRADRS